MRALAFALALSLSLLGAERARASDLPLPGGAPVPPSSYYPISPPVNWAASISASTAAMDLEAAIGPIY